MMCLYLDNFLNIYVTKITHNVSPPMQLDRYHPFLNIIIINLPFFVLFLQVILSTAIFVCFVNVFSFRFCHFSML